MSGARNSVLIFGNGHFAELVRYYLELNSPRRVAAFVALREGPRKNDGTVVEVPTIPLADVLRYDAGRYDAFVAVDSTASCDERRRWFAFAEDAGFALLNYVSDAADVPDGIHIGSNSLVMDGAGIHPFVTVGEDTIVCAGSRIGFRSKIGDHCWLGGARLGESVTVGDCVKIGQNATVAPGLTIANGSVIGPGTLVTTSTHAHEVRAREGSVASRVPSHRLRRL